LSMMSEVPEYQLANTRSCHVVGGLCTTFMKIYCGVLSGFEADAGCSDFRIRLLAPH
jgi:hypothetical protein